jgi:hypothetical protein
MPQTPDAAKSFNDQVRATAVAIAGASADGHDYGFLWECGCEETVRLDLAELDFDGWTDTTKRSSQGTSPSQP